MAAPRARGDDVQHSTRRRRTRPAPPPLLRARRRAPSAGSARRCLRRRLPAAVKRGATAPERCRRNPHARSQPRTPCRARAPPRPHLPADVAHHVLDPGVVLEAVTRQVLAVPGVLESTVRHLGDDWYVRVDPDAAEVEVLGTAHGATVVARPDA